MIVQYHLDQSGLSVIAGIVIDIIVFLGLLGWFIGWQDRLKKKRVARHRVASAAPIQQQQHVLSPPTTTTEVIIQLCMMCTR